MYFKVLAVVGLFLSVMWHYSFIKTVTFSEHRVILSDTIDDEYDYVIVGGGSAGSVMASRLSEEKANKVLLIEAGGFYDENPDFHSIIKWDTLQHTEHDWSYYTEPQKSCCLGLAGNRLYWPRGRVLGGSGQTNAGQYTRGNRYDYDDWSKSGCEGWSYRDVLPYFLKSEDIQIEELKTSKYHHIGGPMAVSGGEYSPLANLYLAAAEELGYNVTDYNGDTQEGFSKIQFNSREGVRDSSAVAYLGRVGKRSNLDIVINTVVTKVDIKDKIATGVFYIRNGRKHFVKAKREVVLSSGAINTPQLLMLSGVGPKDHLKELNIPVVVDLPVGNNLHDHQTVLLPTTINQPIGVTPSELFSFKNHLQYRLFGTGPLAKSEIEVTAFLHADETKRQKTSPDFQVFLVSFLIPFSSYEYKDTVNAKLKVHDEDVHGFSAVLCNTHPKSRGTIRLRSIDPFDHPIIDPLNFYDKRDVEELVSGIRTWEKYLQTPTMKALGVNIEDLKMSICSEHDFPSDEYWECFVRNLAVSVYHICGTCKMGHRDDQNAVVDPQLRVRGIERLRVVDASIFPKITTGNTNAPVVMVAEKAADMILGIDSVKELKEKLPHGV